MIIAIDGLAGSGKTTAGKGLAKAIGFRFISSGQLYRFKALEPDVDLLEAVKEQLEKLMEQTGCEIDKINELASEKIYGIVFVEEG